METLNLYSNLIIAIATVVLAIITGIYVFFTYKILQENKKMREDTYRIIVRTKEIDAFISMYKELFFVINSMSEDSKSEKVIKRLQELWSISIGECSIEWVELAKNFLEEYDSCFMVLPLELKDALSKAYIILKQQLENASTKESLGLPSYECIDDLIKILEDLSYKGQEIFRLRSFHVKKKK